MTYLVLLFLENIFIVNDFKNPSSTQLKSSGGKKATRTSSSTLNSCVWLSRTHLRRCWDVYQYAGSSNKVITASTKCTVVYTSWLFPRVTEKVLWFYHFENLCLKTGDSNDTESCLITQVLTNYTYWHRSLRETWLESQV